MYKVLSKRKQTNEKTKRGRYIKLFIRTDSISSLIDHAPSLAPSSLHHASRLQTHKMVAILGAPARPVPISSVFPLLQRTVPNCNRNRSSHHPLGCVFCCLTFLTHLNWNLQSGVAMQCEGAN